LKERKERKGEERKERTGEEGKDRRGRKGKERRGRKRMKTESRDAPKGDEGYGDGDGDDGVLHGLRSRSFLLPWCRHLPCIMS
jgi:hypothetical protein